MHIVTSLHFWHANARHQHTDYDDGTHGDHVVVSFEQGGSRTTAFLSAEEALALAEQITKASAECFARQNADAEAGAEGTAS